VQGLVAAAILVAWPMVASGPPDPVVVNVRHFSSLVTESFVKGAVEAAARRLRTRECVQVFRDFVDAEGHPLAETLAALRLTPEEYLLNRVWFLDGTNQSACNPHLNRGAITQRNSHVVFICPTRFVGATRQPETIIIHELLHSLGLGENPPSPIEINRRVEARCGG
jgi:hypothetical protein